MTKIFSHPGKRRTFRWIGCSAGDANSMRPLAAK
jgi:hypothetical protein